VSVGKYAGRGAGKLDKSAGKGLLLKKKEVIMASKQQVLGILAGASGPMSRAEVEEKVGESFRSLQTQFVNRWMEDEHLIEDVGEQHYVLTDKGREEALKLGEFKEIEEEPGLAAKPGGGTPEATQESLATTEYQQFLRLGKLTGVVPLQLIKMTADHVWTGDFRDLKWVAQAMIEMDIRSDLRRRWLNAWRGKMHQPIPADLPSEFYASEGKGSEGKREEGAGKKGYILSEDNVPINVGEGSGDLDYKDAVDLAKIRAARSKDAAPAGSSSPVDDAIKIVNLVKSTEGEKAAGKSYIVKPGEDGNSVVEEAEPGKPILVPTSPEAKPGPSYYVGSEGEVQELTPGKPLVIVKEPSKPNAGGTNYLIDQKTGEVKEVPLGQPTVIIRESGQSQSTPIQVKDKDGNPMVLDLSTFIKLEEHRDKQRQDEESHETKMEIAKSFKNMLNKAGTALSHIVEGEEEE